MVDVYMNESSLLRPTFGMKFLNFEVMQSLVVGMHSFTRVDRQKVRYILLVQYPRGYVGFLAIAC